MSTMPSPIARTQIIAGAPQSVIDAAYRRFAKHVPGIHIVAIREPRSGFSDHEAGKVGWPSEVYQPNN